MRHILSVIYLSFLQFASLIFAGIGSGFTSVANIFHIAFVQAGVRHDVKYALTPQEIRVRKESCEAAAMSGPETQPSPNLKELN